MTMLESTRNSHRNQNYGVYATPDEKRIEFFFLIIKLSSVNYMTLLTCVALEAFYGESRSFWYVLAFSSNKLLLQEKKFSFCVFMKVRQ